MPALGSSPGAISFISTIPDFSWLASQIGGDKVDSRALLKGTENPHFVDAVPEFVRLIANAQVVCIAGLELEVGYMPAVLSRSGNPFVQPGGKGFCDLGKSISVLDKPSGPVDRSMGDVHPTGNPHFYLSPKSMAEAAKGIAEVLTRVDTLHKADYDNGLKKAVFVLSKIGEENRSKLIKLNLKEKPLMLEYHREFSYFIDYYGLESFGSIEEKPGVPPSAGRIAEVALAAKKAGVRFVLATDYSPAKSLKRFSELSGIPVLTVPTMVQSIEGMKSYGDVQNRIVDLIVDVIKQSTKSPK